ncbi:Ribosomal silencing factor during starvation [Sesbania bispinosa]|nr:Ribosomal silencing factor during starvation [Sesbania bispinosa]
MLAVLRSRTWARSSSILQPWKLGFSSSSAVDGGSSKCLLDLQEIEKVLTDVKADDVKVIPVPKHCDWADFMAKQKQRGVERMMLPSVEGQAGGKWIVIDSGKVIVHALDEKARAYYNLEGLWTPGTLRNEPIEA